MHLDDYQKIAGTSNALADVDPMRALNAALFGLASETGTLLDIQKKVLTNDVDPAVGDSQFKQELGDLLWYVARVAAAKGYGLEEVAQANIIRVADMWEPPDVEAAIASLGRFDAELDPTEQFPRKMTFRFVEGTVERAGRQHKSATLTLINAQPNAFPQGAISRGFDENRVEKFQGFTLPQEIGAELTDNSRKVDGYRYHDAVHIAFMATLNWSATMRSLLNLKRKTAGDADEFDDSARPIFLEEGLVAVLAGLSTRRMGFAAVSNVDGDTLTAAESCTNGLEVESASGWLWRRAIVKGFEMLRELDRNQGGLLHADLDARTLEFEALS